MPEIDRPDGKRRKIAKREAIAAQMAGSPG